MEVNNLVDAGKYLLGNPLGILLIIEVPTRQIRSEADLALEGQTRDKDWWPKGKRKRPRLGRSGPF